MLSFKQIGCGENYFPTGQIIADHISQQINDGLIDELTGLKFGWWAIWNRRASNRLVNVIDIFEML